MSADIVILEEASFITPLLYYTVIVPLQNVNNTAVLGITTPDGMDNYVQDLKEKKGADGEPVFKFIEVGGMCASCKAAGMKKCGHMLDDLPSWKSGANQAKVDAIMADRPDLNAQENYGLLVSGGKYSVFPTEVMDNWNTLSLYRFEYNVNVIVMAVDPSAGSHNTSDTAIVSVAREGNDYVVIYIIAISIIKQAMVFDSFAFSIAVIRSRYMSSSGM